MKLRELLAHSQINLPDAHPNLDLEVTGLKTNSHTCTAGDLFIGMPGTRVDGGEFWHDLLISRTRFDDAFLLLIERLIFP